MVAVSMLDFGFSLRVVRITYSFKFNKNLSIFVWELPLINNNKAWMYKLYSSVIIAFIVICT